MNKKNFKLKKICLKRENCSKNEKKNVVYHSLTLSVLEIKLGIAKTNEKFSFTKYLNIFG